VQSQTIARPGGSWTQGYGYDSVNRLASASEYNGWSRIYGYDSYGNCWVASSTGLAHSDSKEPQSIDDFDPFTNQLVDVTYDDAGNQQEYGDFALEYDGENRIKTVTKTGTGAGTYVYDGNSRRIKKVWTPNGGSAITTYFVYDATGRLAMEISDGTGSTGTSYPFTDMLGSVRAITAQNGSVTECYDYLPFGRMLSSSDNGRGNSGCYPADPDNQITSDEPQKFTGKEREG
jgi:hypothetical protein